MISLTVEYALRGVVWMASKPGVSQTAREIAAATQVPAGYLSKILNTLVNAGIITSQRGLGGGFLLARDPAALSVLEVINAVEPIERIHSCPLKLPAHAMQLCPLHRQLDAAIATVETAFSSCTVASLTAPPGDAASLCPAKPMNSEPQPNSLPLMPIRRGSRKNPNPKKK